MNDQQELLPPQPGEVLALKREEKGMSLSEAAGRSKISQPVLEALEAGNTSHIPGVYLKGHYRKYASFLGIDDETIGQMLEEISCGTTEIRPVFEGGRRVSSGERWLKISGYLAASVMIVALAWQFTHEAVRISQGETPSRSDTADHSAGESDPAANPVSVAKPTHLNASIAAVGTLREPVAEPAGPDVAAEAWDAIRNPAATAGEHLLVIETSADSWIEIYGQNRSRLEMDLVRAGSSREYRGKGPFDITIGRASAVILKLDGENIDLEPHTHEDVASLLLATTGEFEDGESGENESH